MASNQDVPALLEKAGRLRQTKDTWECASLLARAWITPPQEPPHRPYLLLIANLAGKVLLTHVQKQPPAAEHLLEYLLQAMIRPELGAGRARRPQVIYLNNADYVTTLTPTLAELGIRCQYRVSLPTLTKIRQFLERGLGGRDRFPGLLSIPSVTPPLVNHLYELAADYYRLSPWQWLGDHDPLVIRYPPEAAPHYGIVMGSGGEIFGLSVYDSVDDLKLVFRRDLSHRQLRRRATWLVLFFEVAMAMSFDDLDAIPQFDWPVADEQAYPIFGRTTKTVNIALPTKADLLWLEGALSGIVHYLTQYQNSTFGPEFVEDELLPVTTLSESAQLRLSMPGLEELFDDNRDP
jgi:hypothetical protein